jgi:aminoglycoside phosphotransferase (APT) family kinase protein
MKNSLSSLSDVIEAAKELRPDLAYGEPIIPKQGDQNITVIFDEAVVRYAVPTIAAERARPDLAQGVTTLEGRAKAEVRLLASLNEVVASKLEQEKTLPWRIPQLIDQDEDLGLQFFTRLKGKNLSQCDIKGKGEQELRMLGHALGDFMAMVHALPYDGTRTHQEVLDNSRNYYDEIFRTVSAPSIKSFGVFDDKDLEELQAYLQFTASQDEFSKSCWLHGDLTTDNIMLLDDGSLGIVDFTGARFGLPQDDFVALKGRAFPRAFFEAALEAYNTKSENKVHVQSVENATHAAQLSQFVSSLSAM